ncbi:hypothetical protein VP01_417g2 [Puccinia sorghi]|uniref:Uncharacterized protein n=1 Tax=Puccinia sorghi TaxID=27349 RepID=A0A0L6UQV7_9BASI|nr:hypothetical protein VP01_417g2 [Puccinia sorghi]
MFWHSHCAVCTNVWSNNRRFLGIFACQLQAVEQVFFCSEFMTQKKLRLIFDQFEGQLMLLNMVLKNLSPRDLRIYSCIKPDFTNIPQLTISIIFHQAYPNKNKKKTSSYSLKQWINTSLRSNTSYITIKFFQMHLEGNLSDFSPEKVGKYCGGKKGFLLSVGLNNIKFSLITCSVAPQLTFFSGRINSPTPLFISNRTIKLQSPYYRIFKNPVIFEVIHCQTWKTWYLIHFSLFLLPVCECVVDSFFCLFLKVSFHLSSSRYSRYFPSIEKSSHESHNYSQFLQKLLNFVTEPPENLPVPYFKDFLPQENLLMKISFTPYYPHTQICSWNLKESLLVCPSGMFIPQFLPFQNTFISIFLTRKKAQNFQRNFKNFLSSPKKIPFVFYVIFAAHLWKIKRSLSDPNKEIEILNQTTKKFSFFFSSNCVFYKIKGKRTIKSH